MAINLEDFARWLGGGAAPDERQSVEDALRIPDGRTTRSLRRLESIVAQRCPESAAPATQRLGPLQAWIHAEFARLLADPGIEERFLVQAANRVLVNEMYVHISQTNLLGRFTAREFFWGAAEVVRRILVEQANEELVKRGVSENTLATASETILALEDTVVGRSTVAFTRAYPGVTILLDSRWTELAVDNPQVFELFALGEFAGRTDREICGLLGLSEDSVNHGRLVAEAFISESFQGPQRGEP